MTTKITYENPGKKIRDFKKSEDSLWSIIESARDAMYIEDNEGMIVYWNKAAEKMFGHAKEEAIGRSLYKLLTPKRFQKKYNTVLEEFKRTGKYPIAGKTFKRTAVRKNGEEFEAETSFATTVISGMPYVVSIVRDISERKKTERELNFQNEIMTNMKEGISLVRESDRKIVYVNQKFEKMFGYSPGELPGKKISILNAPANKKGGEIEREINDYLFNTGEWQGEVNNIKKDGTSFWSCVKVSIFDHTEFGKVILYVHTDITERIKIKEALKKSEERYRLLFENMVNGFALHEIITDKEGEPVDYIFLEVNRPFERLTGLKREELIGKKVTEALPGIENDPADWIRRYGEVALTGKEIKFENYFKHLKKWYSVNAYSPSKNQFAVIFEDITERKKEEKQREKLIKDLEKVNKELDNFAHILSHDLKTPIRGIISLVDWIKEDYLDLLDGEGRELLELLDNRARRADELIVGVLNYSSVGYKNGKFEDIDLNLLVPQVINIIAPPESIDIRIKGKLPVLFCSKTLLDQIWQNLIDNAIKFIDKEKGEVHICCKSEGECWKFSVKDNGKGIEKKHFNNIFKIYQCVKQLDEPKGSGIGLSIVKKIIDILGGKIWVESEPGKGSTFFFLLPKDLKEVHYAKSDN